MSKLQQFNGGLAARKAPYLISINEATKYSNIDNSPGYLGPVKDKLDLSQSINEYMHYYEGNSEWISSSNYRDYLDYQNILYWTGTDSDIPQRYDGTNTYRLGIVPPSTAPTTITKIDDIIRHSFDTSSVDSSLGRIAFNLDKSIMYSTGAVGDNIYQYDLSTPGDISTAVYSSIFFNVTAQTPSPTSIAFSTNGNKLYISDSAIGRENIFQYTLGTAWDISTATYDSIVHSPIEITGIAEFLFTESGKILFILSRSSAGLYKYSLSTAWNIATASYTSTKLALPGFTASGFAESFVFNLGYSELYILRSIPSLGGICSYQIYQLTSPLDLTSALFDSEIPIPFTEVKNLIFDIANNYVYLRPDSFSSGNTIVQTYLGLASGTYQYCYTFYNSANGIESQPSPYSDELIASNEGIKLEGLPVTSVDPQVDKLRIYRLGNTFTTMSLVEEITLGASSTYEDYLQDLQIPGNSLDTDTYAEAPTGLQFITEYKGILFGTIDSHLRYTPIGKPWAWPELNYIDYHQNITAIGATAQGLIVCTETKTHILLGSTSETFDNKPLDGTQGCLEHQSMKDLGGTLVWVSNDGLCASSGGSVTVLTMDKLGKVSLLPKKAIVYNKTYWLQQTDGNTFAADARFGLIFKILSLDITSVHTALNKLYGFKAGALYELFKGGTELSFAYISPELTEGSLSLSKLYNHVYICSEGNIEVKIIIDETTVVTKTLPTGKETYDLSIPQEKQRGYSLQLDISGTGKVYEIEYKTVGRKNGR